MKKETKKETKNFINFDVKFAGYATKEDMEESRKNAENSGIDYELKQICKVLEDK
jgi:hypothetical protein